MSKDGEAPPRLGERLLKRVLPSGVPGRSILGDAREEYLEHMKSSSRPAAALWYWKHVLLLAVHFVGGKARRSENESKSNKVSLRWDHFLLDLKLALRFLLKRPGFTLAAVLTLGLGIGANTTIFSMAYGVLLKPLAYPEPDRILGVFRIDPDVTGENPTAASLSNLYAVPYAVFEDWRDLSPVFVDTGAYATTGFTLTGGDRPESASGAVVSSGVFATLGVEPSIGRPFLAEDDEVGAPSLVILSHGMWERRFGSISSVLGREMDLNGTPHTIVGVMPRGFSFPGEGSDLWVTFNDQRKESPERKGGYLQVIARLKPGLSIELAQLEVDAVARRIGEEHPEEKEHGIGLFPHKDLVVANTEASLLLLLGAVGLVLLIACANIASLLMVRASERRREFGLRQALGAGRGRLIGQHLSESVLLALLGGIAGYLFAITALEPLIASFPGGLPRAMDISVDYSVFFIAAGLSILTGLVTGALPALFSGGMQLAEVLRDGSRAFSGGRRKNRTQSVLVVAEVAFAFVLLAGTVLFIRSFLSLMSVEPGFAYEKRLTLRVVLPNQYRESEQATEAFYTRLKESLEALPGVMSVAGAEQMPFVGGTSFPPTSIETAEGIVEDIIHNSTVTPDYFSTMKIPVISGRGLTEIDRKGSQYVAVVSESMARKYWSGDNPIGRRVRVDFGEDPEWITVVGVVGDIKYRLQWDPFPGFYVPYSQWPFTYQNMVIETSPEPSTLVHSAREAVWDIDPDIPVTVSELGERIRDSDALAEKRFGVAILGSLAVLAALLAVIGIYGVLAYTVSQRTHEIGVKMALGAGKGSVMQSILLRGLLLAAIGLGLGWVLTIAFSRVMESLLFEISPTDPVTMIVVALLVSAAAMLASYIPARGATKIDPVEALRQE